MIKRNFTVFFACPKCGACYRAIQAPWHTAQARRFSCEDCKSVVYQWSNAYNYSSWQRYEDDGPAARRDGQVHEQGAQHLPCCAKDDPHARDGQ
jgi:hypothetical protein